MEVPITGWSTARVRGESGESEGHRGPHAALSLRWALCLREQGSWDSRVILAAETWRLPGILVPSLTSQ